MRLLLCFFVYVAAASSQAFEPCSNVVNITSNRWIYPATLQKKYDDCTTTFNFPSDSYATLTFNVTGMAQGDEFELSDRFETFYAYYNDSTGTVNWANSFTVRVMIPEKVTNMRLQMTIVLTKYNPTANVAGIFTVAKDVQPSLIYFNEFKAGTSYIFSGDARIVVQAAIATNSTAPKADKDLLFNNLFIYDNGKASGTMSQLIEEGEFMSKSKNVTLYLLKDMPFRGALLINSFKNLINLNTYIFSYAPVYKPAQTFYYEIEGSHDPSMWMDGSQTIVGDKDGSNPITIRQINNQNEGGVFGYVSGGALSNHDSMKTNFTSSQLPLTLKGNINTLFISKNTGLVKVTTTGN